MLQHSSFGGHSPRNKKGSIQKETHKSQLRKYLVNVVINDTRAYKKHTTDSRFLLYGGPKVNNRIILESDRGQAPSVLSENLMPSLILNKKLFRLVIL